MMFGSISVVEEPREEARLRVVDLRAGEVQRDEPLRRRRV